MPFQSNHITEKALMNMIYLRLMIGDPNLKRWWMEESRLELTDVMVWR
jgi:hypothetical protein